MKNLIKILIIPFFISSCDVSKDKLIIGSWKTDNQSGSFTQVFTKEGNLIESTLKSSGEIGYVTFIYHIKNDTLYKYSTSPVYESENGKYTIEFVDNNNTLIMVYIDKESPYTNVWKRIDSKK